MKAGGAIAFARFMQLALYCPVYGYYETEEDRIGRHGDFYTSVSVGSLFGELLAFQFAQWLGECASEHESAKVHIVEAGAHDRRLVQDILTCLREQRPALFQQLQYWIVEPSPIRQAWQQRTLGEFSTQARWVADFSALSKATNSPVIQGIIFANELLDAMPVQRLGWGVKNRNWFEWGVTLSDGQFVWQRMRHGELSQGTPEGIRGSGRKAVRPGI